MVYKDNKVTKKDHVVPIIIRIKMIQKFLLSEKKICLCRVIPSVSKSPQCSLYRQFLRNQAWDELGDLDPNSSSLS